MSEEKVSDIIHGLPKADLHCHLEACFRYQTLREIGARIGKAVPADRDEFRRNWLVAEPKETLVEMIAGFDKVRALWYDVPAIRRLTREAVEDASRQNVRLLELRYSPDFIQNGKTLPDFDAIHGAILDGIADAKKTCRIAVGLIGIVRRNLPAKEAQRIADFFIGNKDTFVGIDIADQELGYPGSNFVSIFESAKGAGLGVTLHAGEIDCEESRANVRDAINLIGADRVGHGLHIASDPGLIDLVRESGITLELCPSSNLLTGSIARMSDHPLKALLDKGIKTTINTDDPALFAIDFDSEYTCAVEQLGLSIPEVQQCIAHSINASFIPRDEITANWF